MPQALTPVQTNEQFKASLVKQRANIANLLEGTGTPPERFTQILVNYVCGNPKLRDCTLQSKIITCLNVAQVNLSPDPNFGEVSLIPYNLFNPESRRKEMTLTMQVGYKGFIQLGHRGGHVSAFWAHVVYEKDVFEYDYGTAKTLLHRPCREAEKGEKTAAYAVVKYRDGTLDFLVMEAHEIAKHKAMSRGSDKPESPWQQWPDDMWRKTALKKLARVMPKSPELAAAVGLDDAAEIGRPQTFGGVVALGDATVEPVENGGNGENGGPTAEETRAKNMRQIFAIQKEVGMTDQKRHEWLETDYGVPSLTDLDDFQIAEVLDRLKAQRSETQ